MIPSTGCLRLWDAKHAIRQGYSHSRVAEAAGRLRANAVRMYLDGGDDVAPASYGAYLMVLYGEGQRLGLMHDKAGIALLTDDERLRFAEKCLSDCRSSYDAVLAACESIQAMGASQAAEPVSPDKLWDVVSANTAFAEFMKNADGLSDSEMAENLATEMRLAYSEIVNGAGVTQLLLERYANICICASMAADTSLSDWQAAVCQEGICEDSVLVDMDTEMLNAMPVNDAEAVLRPVRFLSREVAMRQYFGTYASRTGTDARAEKIVASSKLCDAIAWLSEKYPAAGSVSLSSDAVRDMIASGHAEYVHACVMYADTAYMLKKRSDAGLLNATERMQLSRMG